jgi:hypothetical protein
MEKENLDNRISKLEIWQKDLLDKKEEAFFIHTKNQMDLQELKEEMSHMNTTIDKIYVSIVGDTMGNIGIVKRMNEQEARIITRIEEQDTRIISLEDFRNSWRIAMAKVGAIGGIIGAVITFLIQWIPKLF